MSEYQFVYFAAVDRALDDKQLAYMRKQSPRAEVTFARGSKQPGRFLAAAMFG